MLIKNPKETCRLGQGEKCCAYLGANSKGFCCIKGDTEMNFIIKMRLKVNSMNAKGIGDWRKCLRSK